MGETSDKVYVWQCTITMREADASTDQQQLFAAKNMKLALRKVDRFLKKKQVEGEVISLARTDAVVI